MPRCQQLIDSRTDRVGGALQPGHEQLPGVERDVLIGQPTAVHSTKGKPGDQVIGLVRRRTPLSGRLGEVAFDLPPVVGTSEAGRQDSRNRQRQPRTFGRVLARHAYQAGDHVRGQRQGNVADHVRRADCRQLVDQVVDVLPNPRRGADDRRPGESRPQEIP
jgi:hypothetical protein